MISHVEEHLYFKAQVHTLDGLGDFRTQWTFFQEIIYISEKFHVATASNKWYLNLGTESDLSNEPRNLADKTRSFGKAHAGRRHSEHLQSQDEEIGTMLPRKHIPEKVMKQMDLGKFLI